jgi:hypothetical protein
MLRKAGIFYAAEVNMTPWLPAGWGGTADAWIYNPELKAFVLVDFKTTKGAGMKYIERGGAKIEHVKQTSAYWHAGRKMGLSLAKKIGVLYIPKDEAKDVEGPLLIDFEPIPARDLAKQMKDRYGAVSDYLASLPKPNPRPLTVDEYVTDALAPVQEREQRIYFDRVTETHEVKLVPHWSAAYCPFPDELCDCRTQSTTKIGMYDIDGTYYPRSGYEHIEPIVEPN